MALVSEACTPTSPIPHSHWSGDEVIQLRAWATEQVYRLNGDTREPLLIGTASSCAIQVHDAASLTSRAHAHLERDGRHWCIVDRSKNGLSLDGERAGKAILVPGMRIGLGPRVTLIAESARTIIVRAALARMGGASFELADEREVALQNLRLAVTGKAVFMIWGEGDLLDFAQELHQLALGKQQPIVFCSPGGKQRFMPGEGALRRVSTGLEALRWARGGTILLDNRRLPEDLRSMLTLLRDARSTAHTLVIVLSKYVRKTEVFTPTPFVIPPLSARQREIAQIFMECERVAAARLDIEPVKLTGAERRWVQEHCSTLSELQTSILRLIAMRHAGSTSGAARLLGLTTSGLQQWLVARELPADGSRG